MLSKLNSLFCKTGKIIPNVQSRVIVEMKRVYSVCVAQNKTLGRVSDTVDPLLGNCSQPHPKVGQGKTVSFLKKEGILRNWL